MIKDDDDTYKLIAIDVECNADATEVCFVLTCESPIDPEEIVQALKQYLEDYENDKGDDEKKEYTH